MAKSKRKRNVQEPSKSHKLVKLSNHIITPPLDHASPAEPKSVQTVISDEELEITVETLNLLAQYPGLIKSKSCKELRVAVYEFRKACTAGLNGAEDASLTSRVTAAITDGKFTDAKILLAEMRIRNEAPKLGALCRWVRDLDVVSGLSMNTDGINPADIQRSEKDKELLGVLDAVLRATGPMDLDSLLPTTCSSIALQKVWDLGADEVSEKTYDSVLNRSIFGDAVNDIKAQFRMIETIPGPQRQPPNHHPAILYASIENAIPLPLAPLPATSHHEHPIVPNLSLIKNVLSPAECKSIIAAGEAVQFLPDAPVKEGKEASILAHNFYWVVDCAFHDRIWERVRRHVPERVGGRLARGFNRRWRVYRYVPGAEYRCHIDGAWPPSSISPTDNYIYDSSPPTARQSSLFTFLIYLNDEFSAGETTFFLPSAKEGVLNAYPVKPVMGAVACFPHGEARGALLHEGTGVRSGAKYVVRTDVIYDVEPDLD